MAVKVEIAEELKLEIFKKFEGESKTIFKMIKSLEQSPNKGKILSNIGGILIKELKYESFRFYFITNGYKLRLFNQNKLIDLLIKFIRMSDKKNQQKTIEEIKDVLRRLGGNF